MSLPRLGQRHELLVVDEDGRRPHLLHGVGDGARAGKPPDQLDGARVARGQDVFYVLDGVWKCSPCKARA